MKRHRLNSLIIATLVMLAVAGCHQDRPTPNFPTTRAYYIFQVFRPTDPRQPRNEVGFDTLIYRVEDGSTRILTNRVVYFTNEYDTIIYANIPADRVLDGYLSARKAQSVSIEVGIIDKNGAKKKQDYQAASVSNRNPAAPTPVRVKLRKEVSLADINDL